MSTEQEGTREKAGEEEEEEEELTNEHARSGENDRQKELHDKENSLDIERIKGWHQKKKIASKVHLCQQEFFKNTRKRCGCNRGRGRH